MAHSKWKPKFKKEKKIGILDKTNTNKQTKMLNTVMAFTFMGKTADLTDVQQAVPQGGGGAAQCYWGLPDPRMLDTSTLSRSWVEEKVWHQKKKKRLKVG